MKASWKLYLALFAVPVVAWGCGGGGGQPSSVVAAPGTVSRSLGAVTYTPGSALVVTVTANPLSNSEYYAVEDVPPAGWTATNISDSGVFDVATGAVKWGPFSDNQNRTFTYTVTPPSGATGAQAFGGELSLDGTTVLFSGTSTISN